MLRPPSDDLQAGPEEFSPAPAAASATDKTICIAGYAQIYRAKKFGGIFPFRAPRQFLADGSVNWRVCGAPHVDARTSCLLVQDRDDCRRLLSPRVGWQWIAAALKWRESRW